MGIDIKTKGSNKTFDEGLEQFIFEYCTLKNIHEEIKNAILKI
jgi:hypothetical protein